MALPHPSIRQFKRKCTRSPQNAKRLLWTSVGPSTKTRDISRLPQSPSLRRLPKRIQRRSIQNRSRRRPRVIRRGNRHRHPSSLVVDQDKPRQGARRTTVRSTDTTRCSRLDPAGELRSHTHWDPRGELARACIRQSLQSWRWLLQENVACGDRSQCEEKGQADVLPPFLALSPRIACAVMNRAHPYEHFDADTRAEEHGS